ncbi:MAG: hypothetical protein AAGC60_04325 [Acidobacteriota bacterium]
MRHPDAERCLLGVAALSSAEDRAAYNLGDPANDRVELPEDCAVERRWNGMRVELGAGPQLTETLDRLVDEPLTARFAEAPGCDRTSREAGGEAS